MQIEDLRREKRIGGMNTGRMSRQDTGRGAWVKDDERGVYRK